MTWKHADGVDMPVEMRGQTGRFPLSTKKKSRLRLDSALRRAPGHTLASGKFNAFDRLNSRVVAVSHKTSPIFEFESKSDPRRTGNREPVFQHPETRDLVAGNRQNSGTGGRFPIRPGKAKDSTNRRTATTPPAMRRRCRIILPPARA